VSIFAKQFINPWHFGARLSSIATIPCGDSISPFSDCNGTPLFFSADQPLSVTGLLITTVPNSNPWRSNRGQVARCTRTYLLRCNISELFRELVNHPNLWANPSFCRGVISILGNNNFSKCVTDDMLNQLFLSCNFTPFIAIFQSEDHLDYVFFFGFECFFQVLKVDFFQLFGRLRWLHDHD
jgi:hypothetical protein